MRTLYHGTAIENLSSILTNGLKKGCEGGVYLTDSKESAIAWTAIRIQHMSKTLLVIEVEVEDENLQPGVDHSPAMQTIFGAGESIFHEGDIPYSNVKQFTKYSLEK